MKLKQTLKAQAPDELAARMLRLALKKQQTTRALPSLVREACVQLVEREEKTLKLEPITPAEVSELLNGKEAVAA